MGSQPLPKLQLLEVRGHRRQEVWFVAAHSQPSHVCLLRGTEEELLSAARVPASQRGPPDSSLGWNTGATADSSGAWLPEKAEQGSLYPQAGLGQAAGRASWREAGGLPDPQLQERPLQGRPETGGSLYSPLRLELQNQRNQAARELPLVKKSPGFAKAKRPN